MIVNPTIDLCCIIIIDRISTISLNSVCKNEIETEIENISYGPFYPIVGSKYIYYGGEVCLWLSLLGIKMFLKIITE